jgi:diacylglycerol kinase family enzyme
VFVVEDLHWFKIWALFPKVYRGTHVAHEKTCYLQAKSVEVDAERETIVSIDGEVVGSTPAAFSVFSGRLRVMCPPVSHRTDKRGLPF